MLQEIGISIILLFLLVTISFTFKGLAYLTTVELLPVVVIGFLLTISVHSFRKDAHFLDALEVPKRLLYLAEYILMLLPLSIVLLCLGKGLAAAVLYLGILPVLLLPAGLIKNNYKATPLKLDFLPPTAFEFKVFLRRFFIALSIFYLLFIAASSFMGTLVLISILIALLIPASFEHFEPKEQLQPRYIQGRFITKKIIENSILFHLLMLPHYALFLFFHLQFWYIGLACVVGIQLVLMFAIVYKYASYHPKHEKIYSSTMTAVFFWTVLTVGFIFISIGLIIHFWRKANKNLAFYYA